MPSLMTTTSKLIATRHEWLCFRDKGFSKKCSFVRPYVRSFVRMSVRPANWRNEESPFLGFLDFFLKGFLL